MIERPLVKFLHHIPPIVCILPKMDIYVNRDGLTIGYYILYVQYFSLIVNQQVYHFMLVILYNYKVLGNIFIYSHIYLNLSKNKLAFHHFYHKS